MSQVGSARSHSERPLGELVAHAEPPAAGDPFRRFNQLQVVSDVAVKLSAVRSTDQLWWEIVRLTQQALGYYYLQICMVEPGGEYVVCQAGWDPGGARHDLAGFKQQIKTQGIVGWVAWSGQSLSVPDVRAETRYFQDGRFPDTLSELAVPLLREGRTIGVLDAQNRHTDAFDSGDVLVMETLARQISVALENAELFERLARSQTALEHTARGLDDFVEMASVAQENDRRRIALDLHDGVVQLLVGTQMEVDALRLSVGDLPPEIDARFTRVADVLQESSKEIRRVVFDLSPPDLANLGLVPTLQRYVSTLSGLFDRQCDMLVSGTPRRIAPHRELAAFRFTQETLSNAFKYAGEGEISVHVAFERDSMQIAVDDTGPGFDLATRSLNGRYGLESIRRNAVRAGGELTLESLPGNGTTITLTVPFTEG